MPATLPGVLVFGQAGDVGDLELGCYSDAYTGRHVVNRTVEKCAEIAHGHQLQREAKPVVVAAAHQDDFPHSVIEMEEARKIFVGEFPWVVAVSYQVDRTARQRLLPSNQRQQQWTCLAAIG